MSAILKQEIVHLISGIPAFLGKGKGDTDWTVELLRRIGGLGVEQGWSVCSSKCSDMFDRGWLFDLTWYHNDQEDHLTDLGLVMESEWNRDLHSIKFDFEKLLVAKAPLKVMVFQDHNENLPELWAYLEGGINRFQSKGDAETYILAAYREELHQFSIRTIEPKWGASGAEHCS